MNQDIERFLNLKNPPGRLTKEQAVTGGEFFPQNGRCENTSIAFSSGFQ